MDPGPCAWGLGASPRGQDRLGLGPILKSVKKDINIEEALSRVRRPLDSTKVTLSVNGIYALPESWKQKITDVSL